MIQWLIESNTAHPALTTASPPPDWLAETLAPPEQATFAALRVEKRRRDWLLGRWTAKRLAQAVIAACDGAPPPLNRLIIGVEASGAPFLEGWSALNLSISHSEGRAFCAAAWGTIIGADIEFITQRAPGLARDFFSEAELLQVGRSPASDTLTTAIWSAKEAALKALKTGLRLDTRRIQCRIEATMNPPDDWMAFPIETHLEGVTGTLRGWWQVRDGFVLTMAARDSFTQE